VPINNRARRPELERVAPVRHFSKIFGASAGTAPPAAPNGAPADPIARGVSLGYQVIEDYMRQGEEFARTVYGGGGGNAGGGPADRWTGQTGDAQAMAGRLFQVVADFATTWIDVMQAGGGRDGHSQPRPPQPRPDIPGFESNAGQSNGHARPHAADTRSPAVPTGPARIGAVTVAVEARQPVEVTLHLRQQPQGREVLVHELRPKESGTGKNGKDGKNGKNGKNGTTASRAARIGNIRSERGPDDALVVRFAVPPGHPEGTYSGMIVDEMANVPIGSLSVRVGAPKTRKTPG
jgi:hypothetical protein